ncbi:DUF6287 domain-containing protein [Candidatus Enterococcus clewellii]|uniref:DUF6287 domain-containing protein n=1 Tax=Candidatus Enterococcus clewellii TaxID=1834193 RepID=A0A242KAU0_9ENTE|nr:DUF6287 domain-containing protein [Enterococcus sp. 9E7_DIV0242]OTP17660.1 hypothetical protein A5888_001798 [Enterococcus sp. 9E7_DIV0242]
MKKKVSICAFVLMLVLAGCNNPSDQKKEETKQTSSTQASSVIASSQSSTEALEMEVVESSEAPSTIQSVESVPPQEVSQDLDIAAINSGDLSTLIGTWQNGEGDVLVINADGTTNINMTVHSVIDSDKTSKVPYANLAAERTGAALGLYRIGFENPDGDNSDKTRPRLVITQMGGDYPAEKYYYRQ